MVATIGQSGFIGGRQVRDVGGEDFVASVWGGGVSGAFGRWW